MTCNINKNLPEYQSRLKASGIPEDVFEAYSSYYLDTYGRLPYLDELPNSNSEQYIKEQLKVKDNLVANQDLEQHVGTSNPIEATIKLNKVYSDKLIEVERISDTSSSISIENRPTVYGEIREANDYSDVQANIIADILHDLSKYSGVDIRPINIAELSKETANMQSAKGFIKNGIIYINTDVATADTPVHELLHIFLGATKFTNAKLYDQLVLSITNTPEFAVQMNRFPDRVNSDIAEELLVTEYSKYVTNQKSIIDNLSEQQKNELNYQVKRALDTAIFGDVSVNVLSDVELFGQSISNLAKLTNSKLILSNFYNTFTMSKQNRQLNNLKSELLRSDQLMEEC